MSEAPNTRQVNGAGKGRQCHHCSRTFTKTEHLERHVYSHTKEKPFQVFSVRQELWTAVRNIFFLFIPNLADESEATLCCATRKTT